MKLHVVFFISSSVLLTFVLLLILFSILELKILQNSILLDFIDSWAFALNQWPFFLTWKIVKNITLRFDDVTHQFFVDEVTDGSCRCAWLESFITDLYTKLVLNLCKKFYKCKMCGMRFWSIWNFFCKVSGTTLFFGKSLQVKKVWHKVLELYLLWNNVG